LRNSDTLEEAAAAYRITLELQPGEPGAPVNLGFAYLQMGQVEKAKDAVTQAGTISSDDPTIHLALVNCI
jgi:cytochrome c-type biogenesis protein CcmH/NrfG